MWWRNLNIAETLTLQGQQSKMRQQASHINLRPQQVQHAPVNTSFVHTDLRHRMSESSSVRVLCGQSEWTSKTIGAAIAGASTHVMLLLALCRCHGNMAPCLA
jgi:hypothetical protein